MFASGIGPNLENRTDPSTGESLQSLFSYRGARGEKTTRRAAIHHDAEGNPTQYARVPVWNSKDDDWGIPEKYRFYQSFRLKDSISLPPIGGVTGADGKYSYNEAGLLAVKQQMYEHHRAVSVNFCAEATGKLTGISALTTTPGTTVDYEVWLLPDDFTGPEDGILIARDTKTFDYGGYHRITLKPGEQKVLARGQKYSVVVRENDLEEDYVCFTMGSANPEAYIQSKAVINPRESFIYADGAWNDVSDRKVQQAIMEYSRPTDVMDNFPIKSYLEPVTYRDGGKEQVFDGYLNIDNWEDGSPGVYEVFLGDSKILTAEFRGIRENMPANWDPGIRWTSSDTSVMTVRPKTPDFAQSSIRGEKAGTAYLTVDAGDYGTRLLRIKVNKLDILYFGLKQNEFKYTGKPIKPELEYIVGDRNETQTREDLVEGVDYILSYRDNVNVGEGLVIATGIGDFTGTAEKSFTITGKTVALKVKGKTVKVKAGTLKKKSVIIKASQAYAVKKAGGRLTYQKAAVSDEDAAKMFTVAKKSGSIKVKKDLKKGTYRLTVKVTAAGSGKRSAASRNVKVTIIVK